MDLEILLPIGNREMVEVLIKHGADANEANPIDGKTPLMNVASQGGSFINTSIIFTLDFKTNMST